MSVLEKNNELIVTKVGRRKYIHRDSIIKLLEKKYSKVIKIKRTPVKSGNFITIISGRCTFRDQGNS